MGKVSLASESAAGIGEHACGFLIASVSHVTCHIQGIAITRQTAAPMAYYLCYAARLADSTQTLLWYLPFMVGPMCCLASVS